MLERHGLADHGQAPFAGYNATYPTFVWGEVVVKLFGITPTWRQSHATERAALALLASDPQIAAPRLLADGLLSEDPAEPWPYLATSRIPGVRLSQAGVTGDERRAVVTELGEQVRRIHALQASDAIGTDADWAGLDVVAAAEHSSLPPHLVAQIPDYLAGLGPSEPAFVHGDMVDMHVLVHDGRLAGIIDWGDAMLTDRHSELIKLMDVFAFDKEQLRIFLDASAWPVGERFARQAMGHALIRQALLLAQHHTSDAFHRLPALVPLQEIGTLDELADELFGV